MAEEHKENKENKELACEELTDEAMAVLQGEINRKVKERLHEAYRKKLGDFELEPDVFFKYGTYPVNTLEFRLYRIAMNCGMFLESEHHHQLIRKAYSLIESARNPEVKPTRVYLASLIAYLDILEVQLRNKGSL
jgi:hypothetical protein